MVRHRAAPYGWCHARRRATPSRSAAGRCGDPADRARGVRGHARCGGGADRPGARLPSRRALLRGGGARAGRRGRWAPRRRAVARASRRSSRAARGAARFLAAHVAFLAAFLVSVQAGAPGRAHRARDGLRERDVPAVHRVLRERWAELLPIPMIDIAASRPGDHAGDGVRGRSADRDGDGRARGAGGGGAGDGACWRSPAWRGSSARLRARMCGRRGLPAGGSARWPPRGSGSWCSRTFRSASRSARSISRRSR